MTKKLLVIKSKKANIKEVEVNIKQILDLTGLDKATKFTFDMTKVAIANVELLVNIAFSFRSLSFDKISKNLNEASDRFGRRVRSAMSSADSLVSSLAQESGIRQCFLYTAPSVAIFDYMRKNVDDSGGLEYFFKNAKIGFSGDIFRDIASVVASASEELTKPGESNPQLEIAREKLDMYQKDIKKFFLKEYGVAASNLINDIVNKKNTVNIQGLLSILNDTTVSKEQKAQNMHDYLTNLKESFSLRTFQTSMLINSKKIILEDKEEKLINNQYENLVELIASLIDKSCKEQGGLLVKFNPILKEIKQNEKNDNVIKEDIEIFENFLNVFLFIMLDVLMIEMFIEGKNLKADAFNKFYEFYVNEESKNKVKTNISKVIQNYTTQDEETQTAYISSIMINGKKNITSKDTKISQLNAAEKYIKEYFEFYNAKDEEYNLIKEKIEELITKLQKVNFNELQNKLQNKLTGK